MIRKNPQDMSAHELYLELRSFIISEQFGINKDSDRLSYLFEEAERRNPQIYHAALDDATISFINVDINSKSYSTVYRSEFMNEDEISVLRSKLIGAEVNDLDTKANDLFFSVVEGESMIGAGLSSGDEVIVSRTKKANSGDIILAKTNGDVFIKRLKVTGGSITLCSENPDYEDFDIYPDDDFEILGVVIRKIGKL